MNKILSALLLVISAFVLTACAPKVEENDFSKLTDKQRAQKIISINELEEHGRIGLMGRYNQKSFSVNCTYYYNKDKFSLELNGPMGLQYAKIEVYANGTTYLKVQGDLYKGDNARELLNEQFNIDIPVEDLHSVIVGLPKGDVVYDELGYPKEATVGDEYKVIYRAFKPRKNFVLPSYIEILTPLTKLIFKVNDITILN